jgi:MFS family permease
VGNFLRLNNILKLTFAKFFASVYFAVPIQTIFFFKLGLTFAQVMWLESILLVGIFLFEIPTGILGDTIGRKNSLVLGALVNLVAWIPWFLGSSFWLFAISYFLAGIGIAFASGSDQALIYDDLKQRGQEGGMQRWYGIYSAAPVIASAVSGLVGGFIAVSQTLDIFYLLYKLTVIMNGISLLILLAVQEAPVLPADHNPVGAPFQRFQLFSDGWRLIKGNPKLRRIILLSLFSSPFSIVLVYIFQPYFQASQVPNIYYGVAVFASAILGAGCKLLAYKIEAWLGVNWGTLMITLLPGILWAVMALLFHPVFAVLFYIINISIAEIREPVFADYLNRHIPSYNRATVLSTISVLGSLYQFIIRPVIGYLADINLRYAFILIALIIFLATSLFRIQQDHVLTQAGHV